MRKALAGQNCTHSFGPALDDAKKRLQMLVSGGFRLQDLPRQVPENEPGKRAGVQ